MERQHFNWLVASGQCRLEQITYQVFSGHWTLAQCYIQWSLWFQTKSWQFCGSVLSLAQSSVWLSPTPNKSVHSTAWTLWSLGPPQLPAPQWFRLHYCCSRAGAAPAIDVANTLYKAAQSPGGGGPGSATPDWKELLTLLVLRNWGRSYFPVNQLMGLQYSALLAAAPALPSHSRDWTIPVKKE